MPSRCATMIPGEGAPLQCQNLAGYGPEKRYCKSCTRVWYTDFATDYDRPKEPKRAPLETPWAKRVFGRFSDWFTRKAWPVGSVLLRRNSNGMFDLPHGRGKMPYGLGKGTGDWIGWKSVVVTPEMVGHRVAIYTSIEAKRDGMELRDRQKRWHEVVIENGGLSYRASPETEADVLLALGLDGHPGVPPADSSR